MPNHGRSGRCLTCRRRRVKCDEVKPACSPCRRLNLHCDGYAKHFTFKRDESYKYISAAKEKRTLDQRSDQAVGEPSRSLLTGADVAVPFFLIHYANMGRRLAVARGFYETLIPVYTLELHDSPLSLAVSALAARVLSIWRDVDAGQVDGNHAAPYTQAVSSLRSVLAHPDDCRKPATALAVLALHLYESINAVYDARQATSVHHYGALSLLPVLPVAVRDRPEDVISNYVRGFVLHTEISSALRQKRSIHPSVYSCIKSPHTSFSLPGNLSSTLDSIGASVAELQADFLGELSRRHESDPLPEHQRRVWITEVRRIDGLLLDWARSMPLCWRPLRLKQGQDFSSLIPAYRLTCDVYPSCQIATLWNLWRFHRLLLLKVSVEASSMQWKVFADDKQLTPTSITESVMQADCIQNLVDGFCYSIPFYLGNRSKPSSLSDFGDSNTLFPSYHSLISEDARTSAMYQRLHTDGIVLSKDEHHRHMIAYGAWHVVSPLSNLLTLMLDDHDGRLMVSFLRPDQQEWIREQFLRVSMLVRLPIAGPFTGVKMDGSSGSFSQLSDSRSLYSRAEDLAKQVRKGALFMSGP